MKAFYYFNLSFYVSKYVRRPCRKALIDQNIYLLIKNKIINKFFGNIKLRAFISISWYQSADNPPIHKWTIIWWTKIIGI